jgi:hypothetical protein
MSRCTDARRYPGLRPGLTTAVAAAVLAAFAFPGCGSSNDTSSQESAGLLFAQTAISGTLHEAAGSSTLTLHGIYPSVTAFSDRPERTALQIPNASFAQLWQQPTFQHDPPNAALVIGGAPASADVFILELRKPRLGGRSISYRASSVTDSGMTSLDQRGDPVRNAPTSFRDASLLIDDVALSDALPALAEGIASAVANLPQGIIPASILDVGELANQAQQLLNADTEQAVTLVGQMTNEVQQAMNQLDQSTNLSAAQQDLVDVALNLIASDLAGYSSALGIEPALTQAPQGSTEPALTQPEPGN